MVARRSHAASVRAAWEMHVTKRRPAQERRQLTSSARTRRNGAGPEPMGSLKRVEAEEGEEERQAGGRGPGQGSAPESLPAAGVGELRATPTNQAMFSVCL